MMFKYIFGHIFKWAKILNWSVMVISPFYLVYIPIGQISFEVTLFCSFNHRLFCSECDEQSRMSSLMLSLLFLVMGVQKLGKLKVFSNLQRDLFCYKVVWVMFCY